MKTMHIALMLLLIALLLPAGGAYAHKVNVFAYVEGGKLMGQGYFSGGAKAQNSRVILHGPDGAALAETKTDKKGEFTLDLPAGKAPLTVELIASSGHRATYTMNAKELGLAAGAGKAKAAAAKEATPGQAKNMAPAAIDQAALQAAIAGALAKELGPIKAQLARMEADRGVGVQDVIGGLGYILGLLGLGAYMQFRKRRT